MPEIIYTDTEIKALIQEEKIIPKNWGEKAKLTGTRVSKNLTYTVKINERKTFYLIRKVNSLYNYKFSAILSVEEAGIPKRFTLKRYDSKHQHTNPIEGETFNDFHIHTATERYQEYGMGQEEKYAVITNRFQDITGAISCLLDDCGFKYKDDNQLYFNEMT